MLNRVQRVTVEVDNVVQVLYHCQPRAHRQLLQIHGEVEAFYAGLNNDRCLFGQVQQMKYLETGQDMLDTWDEAFLDRLERDLGGEAESMQERERQLGNTYLGTSDYRQALGLMEDIVRVRQDRGRSRQKASYADYQKESTMFYRDVDLAGLEGYLEQQIQERKDQERSRPQ